jgi:hypothetical protein
MSSHTGRRRKRECEGTAHQRADNTTLEKGMSDITNPPSPAPRAGGAGHGGMLSH